MTTAQRFAPALAVLTVLAAAAVYPQVPPTPAAPTPAVHELLEGYWAGDFAIVSRRFTSGRQIAEMVPKVRAWVESSAARGWQFASFVLFLDLADAALRLPDPAPEAAVALIAFGRDEITAHPRDARPGRQARPDQDLTLDVQTEALWHQTALALLQAQKAWLAQQDLLKAIERRFEPDPPARLWLARAIALEQRYAGAPLVVPVTSGSARPTAAMQAMEEALRHYDHAARDAGVRVDASARAAWLLIRMERHRDALRRIDLAGEANNDLVMASWLPYLRGRAFSGIGEHTRAIDAYEQALQLNPAAAPVRSALIAALRAAGRAVDADALDAKFRQAPPPALSEVEPWAILDRGEYRYVPDWLARLKGLLETTMKSKSGAAARPPVLVVLDRYEAGDYDFAVNSLVSSDLATFVGTFRESADRWIAEGEATVTDHRRLVAATVALEAGRARGFIEWPRAQLLIEWACERLRAQAVPTEAERIWDEAAAAVMEGAVAGTALEIHVTHALKRFPDDPPLVMARAVAAELRAGPDQRLPIGTRAPAGSSLDTAVTRLQQAILIPAYRDEANLRLGYTALRRGKFADALAPLELAAGNRTDLFIGYLAELFRGRALERMLRWNEAVNAYRAAVAIQPKAQTAELALAAALARVGQPVEAARLADTVLSRTESVFDPWLAYGQGDFRHWPRIVAALRSAIR